MEKKTVVIVGVGALGSHLAVMLRNHARLRLVDFDRVETKNVLSQSHSLSSVGKNKAISLQKTMVFLYGVAVEAMPHKLTPMNVKELLSGSDIVVDCVDDGDTRRLIQGFCRINSKPCLHGGLAAGGQFGQVAWTEQFQADDRASGAATCEDGEHLPFISKVAAQLAIAVHDFVRRGEKRGYLITKSTVKEI